MHIGVGRPDAVEAGLAGCVKLSKLRAKDAPQYARKAAEVLSHDDAARKTLVELPGETDENGSLARPQQCSASMTALP